MRICLKSFVVRELQVKATIWCHYTSFRMAKIQKKTDNTNCWQGCRTAVTLIHCRWETVWQCPTKLKMVLCNPAIKLLGIYQTDFKTYVYIKSYMWMFMVTFIMFMVVLIIVTKNWSQPICPPTGEWIKKLWYMCTMKYCSMIKSEPSSHKKTWISP